MEPAPACPGPPVGAHLLLGGDEAGSDACGVDATIPILVDLDVGPAVAGVRVTGAIKQVEDLLVVELCGGRKSCWVHVARALGPRGAFPCL